MRLFKHGQTLAVVIPEAMRKKMEITENTEMEFIELEKGTLVLIEKATLEEKVRQDALSKLYSANPAFVTNIPTAQPQQASKPTQLPDPLNGKSYLIIETEAEIRRLNAQLEAAVKKREILGTQGPDKKYYVVKTEFYSLIASKVNTALAEKESTLAEVVEKTNLDPKLAQLAIYIMKDQGEVLERKKGMYSLVK